MQRSVTAFDTQMANIEKSNNALTLQDAELKQISSNLSADNENNFKDFLTKTIDNQVDNIYKLGYNSIGRDQTEYLKAQSNLLNSLEQLTEGLALMDAESKQYEEAKLSGNIIGLVSNATEKGARAFMDDIYMNNGNNITSTYENGSFILRHKDGYAVNLSNYKSVLEKGGDGIIKYINDPSKELKTIYSQHSSKYEALVKQITQNTVTEDGKKVVQTTLEKDYELANDETREAMINDPNLLAMINQDTFQWAQANNLIKDDSDNVITGQVFGGLNKDIKVMEKQIKQTAEALVDYSMDQYGKETQVTKFIQKPKPPARQTSPRGAQDKNKFLDYSDWIKENILEVEQEFEAGKGIGPLKPGTKTGKVKSLDYDDAKKAVQNKIIELNANVVYGSDPRVIEEFGNDANASELYEIKQTAGGKMTINPVPLPKEKVMNSKALNKIIISYTPAKVKILD